MHFKNGREAKYGDPVIGIGYHGRVIAGVIHNLNPGSTTCNCDVVTVIPGGTQNLTCQNVSNFYHADDAFKAIETLTSSS